MRIRSWGLVAVLAFVIAACGGAAPEGSGPSEGIQVHGDWTIDIYNEDGSLDRTVEFSNALNHGGQTVTRMLAREISPKLWQVHLTAPSSASSPCLFNGAESICVLGEHNGTLSVQPIEGSVPGIFDVLRLQGLITADQAGELLTVETTLQGCAFGTPDPPEQCAGVTFGDEVVFSGTDLAASVVVEAGQSIDVRVDLSFTSG